MTGKDTAGRAPERVRNHPFPRCFITVRELGVWMRNSPTAIDFVASLCGVKYHAVQSWLNRDADAHVPEPAAMVLYTALPHVFPRAARCHREHVARRIRVGIELAGDDPGSEAFTETLRAAIPAAFQD